MRRPYTALILVLVAHLGCATHTDSLLGERALLGPGLIRSWRSHGISDGDSAEILKLSLKLAVVDREICDMHLEPEPKHIFVFSEAGVPIPLPELENVTFSYVTPQHIRHILRTGRGLSYLKVSGEVLETGRVVVHIDRVVPVHGSGAQRWPDVSICSVVIELARDGSGWNARSLGGVIA